MGPILANSESEKEASGRMEAIVGRVCCTRLSARKGLAVERGLGSPDSVQLVSADAPGRRRHSASDCGLMIDLL